MDAKLKSVMDQQQVVEAAIGCANHVVQNVNVKLYVIIPITMVGDVLRLVYCARGK